MKWLTFHSHRGAVMGTSVFSSEAEVLWPQVAPQPPSESVSVPVTWRVGLALLGTLGNSQMSLPGHLTESYSSLELIIQVSLFWHHTFCFLELKIVLTRYVHLATVYFIDLSSLLLKLIEFYQKLALHQEQSQKLHFEDW